MELFMRGVAAANRSDTEGFLDLLHAEVEWHTVLPMVGGDAVYRRIDGVRGFLEDVWDVLSRTDYEFPDVRDLGDRLLAIGRIRVTGDTSGAVIDSPFAYVIDFQDGKPRVIRSCWIPARRSRTPG